MTRTSNLNRADCTGTGAITPIPINFPFAAATDLIVYQLDTSNVQTTLTLNVDYTVAGAGTTSGTVTPVAAIPSGYHWTVLREVDLTQETDIRNQGAYYPEIIEDALDKLTDITQQLSERMDRAVIAQTTSTSTYALPVGQLGYALGWVDDPTVLEAVPNTATSQAADLASATSTTKGMGMVGAGDLAYAEGTLGERVVRLDKTIATAGTAPDFTLTPTTALSAYTTGKRYRVSFHAGGTTGSNTLNISGLGAKDLKQYLSSGAKTSGVVTSGMICDVEYDGTDFVILNPLYGESGRLIGVTYYLTAGVFTYTKATNNPSFIRVRQVGGGGSGATSSSAIAGPGAGGGYSEKKILNSALSASETINIGAGGAAGTAGTTANGNSGGATSFGYHCTSTGGYGGSSSWAAVNGGVGYGGDMNAKGTGVTGYGGLVPGGASAFSAGASGAAGTLGAGGANVAAGSASYKGGDGAMIIEEYT